MARVYADLIRKGLKTLEQVPAKLRAAVAALLEPAAQAENEEAGANAAGV